MDLSHYDFSGYHCREAFALENKIVYFGDMLKSVTFVLEKEEDSEQLRVVREDSGFAFERGAWNTASCTFRNEIYAF